MTATILQFRPREPKLPPHVEAFLNEGIRLAIEKVATGRSYQQLLLEEAEEMLRRGAAFREYVHECGRDEPLMTLMQEHYAAFPSRNWPSAGPESAA